MFAQANITIISGLLISEMGRTCEHFPNMFVLFAGFEREHTNTPPLGGVRVRSSCSTKKETEKMTDDQVKLFCDAINNLAEAIREAGARIAEDEPLNFSVRNGLQDIKEEISDHNNCINETLEEVSNVLEAIQKQM